MSREAPGRLRCESSASSGGDNTGSRNDECGAAFPTTEDCATGHSADAQKLATLAVGEVEHAIGRNRGQ